MTSNQTICSRCVMDTSDKYISFDSKGHCNHCNQFYLEKEPLVYKDGQSNEELHKLVKKIKKQGQNNKYDCLIGMSGGVDSAYVAYLVNDLGLRPLAVHMDNGWNAVEATANIRAVCESLNIDYQSHVLNWKTFKDIQLSLLKSSIVEVELATDIAIQGVLHQAAIKHNIKFMIGGGNYATEGILPDSWFYDPRDKKLLKSIHKKFGTTPFGDFPTFGFFREIYCKFFKGIKTIYILNYFPYSRDNALKLLTEKLGYQDYGGKHHESTYTKFVQSYYQPMKFNLDYRRATFSSAICNNDMTREDALIQLSELPYDPDTLDASKEYVAKKFDLTLEEFEAIANQEPKSYKDYPNNERFLTFIYKIYRHFFKKF
ncbi:N-acetyl sugar amidotransferase [Gammaproteobacteria bacterium]|nr:N-acetyl sugar amidotransferase [Gammaproteobacteria bacterium]